MPDSSPASLRRPWRWPLLLAAVLLAIAAAAGSWLALRIAGDRSTAVGLAEAMTAPRFAFDGRTFEAHFSLAVEDLAATQGTTPPAIRAALDRFASGGWFAAKRAGYDAFLAQLASRRFESAIATVRELAEAAKTGADTGRPAWQLLATAGVLELSRGRTTAADPLLQQAFDLASRAGQLDTPQAASLLAACGTLQLARNQPEAAEPCLRRATALLARAPGADLRDRARVLALFAQSIATQGFPEEAEPLYSQALALAAQFRHATGRPDTHFAIFEENYRKLLRQRGLAEAEIEAQLRAALEPR